MTKTNEAKQKLRMAGRTLMRCYEQANTLQGQCDAARKDCLSAERAVGICQEHLRIAEEAERAQAYAAAEQEGRT